MAQIKPVLPVQNAVCPNCSQVFVPNRKGQIYCTSKCRRENWTVKRNGEMRDEIIERHLASMNAELESRGLGKYEDREEIK